MLNLISILFGLLGVVLAIVGFIPFLGWTLWLAMIVPVIGAGLGFLSSSNAGRNFNLFVLAAMVLRLLLGGGII